MYRDVMDVAMLSLETLGPLYSGTLVAILSDRFEDAYTKLEIQSCFHRAFDDGVLGLGERLKFVIKRTS